MVRCVPRPSEERSRARGREPGAPLHPRTRSTSRQPAGTQTTVDQIRATATIAAASPSTKTVRRCMAVTVPNRSRDENCCYTRRIVKVRFPPPWLPVVVILVVAAVGIAGEEGEMASPPGSGCIHEVVYEPFAGLVLVPVELGDGVPLDFRTRLRRQPLGGQ